MAKKRTKARAGGAAPMRSFRVSDEEWRAWNKAAAAAGVTLSHWLRSLANREAQTPPRYVMRYRR